MKSSGLTALGDLYAMDRAHPPPLCHAFGSFEQIFSDSLGFPAASSQRTGTVRALPASRVVFDLSPASFSVFPAQNQFWVLPLRGASMAPLSPQTGGRVMRRWAVASGRRVRRARKVEDDGILTYVVDGDGINLGWELSSAGIVLSFFQVLSNFFLSIDGCNFFFLLLAELRPSAPGSSLRLAEQKIMKKAKIFIRTLCTATGMKLGMLGKGKN